MGGTSARSNQHRPAPMRQKCAVGPAHRRGDAMLDALVWFAQNVAMGFYNTVWAITHPGAWLNWADPNALVRVIYYGASVEFFFFVLNTVVVITLIGLWKTPVLWGGVRTLESIGNTVGRIAAWAGLIMVLQQIVVVFVQRIFAVSQISIGFWTAITFDVSWWSEGLKLYNAMLVALCVSYTFVQGGHVRVDVLYANLSWRAKRWVDMIGALIFMVPVTVLIWLYAWFFMWRHLVVPAPSAGDTFERLEMRARILRWNVETTGFAPQGFSAYFLFKVLLVLFAALVFLQAVAVIWRAIAELREGEESIDKYLDRDKIGDEAEELEHKIHSGAT
jgi:TRAP-type mannitol/chloroaromatic compound transport system permease small subunit